MASHTPSEPYPATPCSVTVNVVKFTRERRFPHKKRKRRRGPPRSEVHDALFSLGRDDRTGRLSNAEFSRQLAGEFGYLADTGIGHLSSAAGALFGLLKLILFGK